MEDKTFWFVSYSFVNHNGTSGFGSIEITTGELFIPSKVRDYIKDSINAKGVVVLNYKRMQESELAEEETDEDS